MHKTTYTKICGTLYRISPWGVLEVHCGGDEWEEWESRGTPSRGQWKCDESPFGIMTKVRDSQTLLG
jgi:hypothetical protein